MVPHRRLLPATCLVELCSSTSWDVCGLYHMGLSFGCLDTALVWHLLLSGLPQDGLVREGWIERTTQEGLSARCSSLTDRVGLLIYDPLGINLSPFRRSIPYKNTPFPTGWDCEISKSVTSNLFGFLPDHLGKEVKVTGEVFRAAAGNGAEVATVLMGRRIEEIVEATMAVNPVGERIKTLELLFDRRAKIEKTGRLVLAMFETCPQPNDYKLRRRTIALLLGEITRLLDREEEGVKVTERIIQTAAGNWAAEGILKLLLDRNGEEVNVAERIVRAAIGNGWFRVLILELLLDRKG